MKTLELKPNCSSIRNPLTTRLLAFMTGVFCGLASVASAQTFVPPGPTSGEWNVAGSPYLIVDNITVPSGQTLTIDPGVTVLIGSNLTVTANGSLIQAIGTPSQRITIGATSSAFAFNEILVQNETGTNRFHYCDFANARTAIAMGMYANNQIMPVEIMNCTFSNCLSQAIYGEAQGQAVVYGGNIPTTLNAVIKNCIFNGMSNGCVMNIFGSGDGIGDWGYGNANPVMLDNIFQNITGSAFLMEVGSTEVYGSGKTVFVNNTIVNCKIGVSATDPWDAVVQSCIFNGCTNAVKVSGSLSRTVSYNDFYGNATNFIGLPGSFGQIIWANRNGSPADVLYNIYQNPIFVATNDFHLTSSSPCINAGTPNPAYANMCFPPSIATNFPDLGAYGGPDACNWLPTVPLLPTHLTMTESNGFVWLNWNAIPRSSYQVEYFATNFNATHGTNRWLTNSINLPAARPYTTVVATAPSTNKQVFYRVRSLGRTPGN